MRILLDQVFGASSRTKQVVRGGQLPPNIDHFRSSLPSWAQNRRLSRHFTTGALPVFIAATFLSWLLTPAGSLYTPVVSAVYSPPQTGSISTSIIVPTFRERDNLAPLVHATFAALPPALASRTEILFVDDDSGDGTEEEVARLREEGYTSVELLTRPRSAGESGLSSAVLRGFERARGTRLVVMDADLQHPPVAIPDLVAALGGDPDSGDEEDPTLPSIALGTRYGRGVSMDANWPLYRRVISWGARMLARPLTSASDPMTGFFAVRKAAFLRARPLSPSGFKIALELLLALPSGASHPPEVPYAFGVRTQGASKLGARVMLKYVGQLLRLYARVLGIFWHMLVGAGVAAGVWMVRGGGGRLGKIFRRAGLTGKRRNLLPVSRLE